MSVASASLRLDSKKKERIYGRLWLFFFLVWVSSDWYAEVAKIKMCPYKQTENWILGTAVSALFLLRIQCQSGQMLSFLCDQCGMTMASHFNQRHSDFLAANESKSSHIAKIWSGLSKCRNITGIPEEMCSGLRFNQEKAAELAQMCHHKNVFLA